MFCRGWMVSIDTIGGRIRSPFDDSTSYDCSSAVILHRQWQIRVAPISKHFPTIVSLNSNMQIHWIVEFESGNQFGGKYRIQKSFGIEHLDLLIFGPSRSPCFPSFAKTGMNNFFIDCVGYSFCFMVKSYKTILYLMLK